MPLAHDIREIKRRVENIERKERCILDNVASVAGLVGDQQQTTADLSEAVHGLVDKIENLETAAQIMAALYDNLAVQLSLIAETVSKVLAELETEPDPEPAQAVTLTIQVGSVTDIPN